MEKKQIINMLETKFEKALVEELENYSVMQFPANTNLGKVGDDIRFISIVLQGSIRTVRKDKNGDEILIYNIDPLESCIISITSAIKNQTSKLMAFSNNETTAIVFPKEKSNEWFGKYQSWRNFTIDLYEKRLNELLDNHLIIKQQKDNIIESIRYAERIQNAALTPPEVIESMLPEHFIFFKPKDIVSGDYYWMTQIENKTIVAVADCTGHGVPGAFMSMLGISILNQYVNDKSIPPANIILDQLREQIKKSLRQKDFNSETRDGMDMALVIFDFEHQKLEFAGANNPLIIIRNNELIKLEADKMPVGVHVIDNQLFRLTEFDIMKNDCFYAFSDGFVDQIGGENSRKFLSRNFTDLLLKIHIQPMAEQKIILQQTFQKWQGVNQQIDDILVLGIRYN